MTKHRTMTISLSALVKQKRIKKNNNTCSLPPSPLNTHTRCCLLDSDDRPMTVMTICFISDTSDPDSALRLAHRAVVLHKNKHILAHRFRQPRVSSPDDPVSMAAHYDTGCSAPVALASGCIFMARSTRLRQLSLNSWARPARNYESKSLLPKKY